MIINPGYPAQNQIYTTTPGPGYYNLNQGRIPGGPVYTLAKKFKEKKLEENNKQAIKDGYPGPGAYNVKNGSLFSKNVRFTKDKKFKDKKFVTPGPGQYKIPTAFDYINDYTRSKGVFDPTFKYV